MVNHEFDSFHAHLENRVQAALDKSSVFSIGSFGWRNENDPDPDFIGHAMWQVDARPVDRFIIFENSQNQEIPSELEKEIYITGEEFWGLMEASRRMGQFVAERLSNTRKSRKRLDGDRANRQRAVLEEIDRGIGQLRNWYELLITTSNHVFQIEYSTRRSANVQKAAPDH